MKPVPGTTPFNVDELKPCAICRRGVMHDGSISFYEVTARHCGVDVRNVQRMHGMEHVMGGHVPLARIFSPDNTVAHRIGEPTRTIICQSCAVETAMPVAVLVEGSDHV